MFSKVFDKLQGDKVIWMIVILLSILSMLAVYSATGTLAYKSGSANTEYFLGKHFALMGFGLLLMYGAHLLNPALYSRIGQILLFISVPLLLYTLLFGKEVNEAKRWITLPVIHLTFQTSDLAKLALVMYLARILTKKQEVMHSYKDAFIPLILPVFLICGLIAPANLSTAIVIFVTSVLIMFIGRAALGHIAALIFISFLAGSLFIATLFLLPEDMLNKVARMSTWKSRIESFTKTENMDDNYQVTQAKIAIAKGGIFGKGPGQSTQRNFLPYPYADFIYAIILEEYGLTGGLLVIILYLILLWRAIRIVARSPDAFGALLAIGLAISLVLQAFIHMAVAVNLLPVTGLTLPLVSMGGTSIFFMSLAMGIILSVSREVESATSSGSTTHHHSPGEGASLAL